MNHTPHFIKYQDNIKKLRAIPRDNDYVIKLLYANVITLMELYLLDALIFTIQDERKLLIKVTESRPFKNSKVYLKTAYTNDMERYLIAKIKEMVFHRISEVFVLHKDILGITFQPKLEKKILNAIKKRHHIIHRNGKDLDGNTVEILNDDLDSLIITMDSFLSNIDNQLYQKFGK